MTQDDLQKALDSLDDATRLKLDVDGDGEINVVEYEAFLRRAEAERFEIAELTQLLSPEELALVDVDGDGEVSIEEYRAYLAARGTFFIYMRQSASGRCRRVLWNGTSRAELLALYLDNFYPTFERQAQMGSLSSPGRKSFRKRQVVDIDEDVRRPADVRFVLQHSRFGVCFTNFNLNDIKEGCMLCAQEIFADASPGTISAQTSRNENEGEASGDGTTLSLRERVWMTLDDPLFSPTATAIFVSMMVLIVLSTVTFCIDTMPRIYDHSGSFSHPLVIIEAVCIAIFTAELAARFWACPDRRSFSRDTMNLIDLVAVVPFYIELIATGVEVPGLAVLRVFRLVRVFRLFKMNRGPVQVFASTMERSARPLYMLLFFVLIALVVFSSLLYYVETPVYDDGLRSHVRHVGWECDFTFAYEPPLRYSVLDATQRERNSGLDDPCVLLPLEQQDVDALAADADAADPLLPHAYYRCPSTYSNGNSCAKVWEETPFESIPATMWFSLETMTSLGYGDFVPVSALGKSLCMFIMASGLLVLSLPISVVGNNFTTVYQYMQMQERREKQAEQNRLAREEEAALATKQRSARRRSLLGSVGKALISERPVKKAVGSAAHTEYNRKARSPKAAGGE